MFGVLPLFALALVAAAVVTYFHSTDVTIVASEGRQSEDIAFTLSCFSGETVTKDLTIRNWANVALDSRLSWVESSNPDGVLYTNNLPMVVTTDALSTGTYTASFTCSEVTPAGTVNGVIHYEAVESI